MTGDLAPDGVEALQSLAQGLWSGRMGGREVVVREVADAAALAPADILKRVNVPGLPLLIDARSRDGHAWVIFEKVHGVTLATRLDREGPLPSAAAVNLVRRGARALDALGRAGLRHGAICPANIVFDDQGGVTFIDPVWSPPCWPVYEAPEGPVDVRSDLYSLGLVFCEMLLGMPPFVTSDRADLALLKETGRIRFDAILGLSPEAAEAGGRLTEPDRGHRLGDPVELLRRLNEAPETKRIAYSDPGSATTHTGSRQSPGPVTPRGGPSPVSAPVPAPGPIPDVLASVFAEPLPDSGPETIRVPWAVAPETKRILPPPGPETKRIRPPPAPETQRLPTLSSPETIRVPWAVAPESKRIPPRPAAPRTAVLVTILLGIAAAIAVPVVILKFGSRSIREGSPAPAVAEAPPPSPPVSVPAATPSKPTPPPSPPAPPPVVLSPEETAAERTAAEAFVATADGLVGRRDYDRLDALTPPLRSAEGRARLDELIAPHRRAGRAWSAAMAQIADLKDRAGSFLLRPDGKLLAGRVEEIRLPRFRVGGQEVSVLDLSTTTIVRLASTGRGAAADLDILTFALLEKDASSARALAQGVELDPWAAARLASLPREGDDVATRKKAERAADLALRAAENAVKEDRPEIWRDVAERYPGTAAAKSALEKVTALRTSVARWSWNDGQPAGWTGEIAAGGRWSFGGSRLKASVKDGVASAERRGSEPLFTGSKDARLRFDFRIQGKAKVTVTLEGEGGTATASVDSDDPAWQTFDRLLPEFEGAAFVEGKPVRAIRIESRSEGALKPLTLDSVEVYVPK